MTTYLFIVLGVIILVLFCIARDKKTSALAIILKTFTSIFFIATACSALISNVVDSGNTSVVLPGVLVLFGLVLGMIGDITLDFKIYFKGLIGQYENAEKDADAMTYIGMLSFGIGHILYITSTAIRYPGYEMNLLWSALISLAIIAVVFVVSIFVLKMNFGKFLIPSICYGFLLAWFVAISISDLKEIVSTASIIQLVGSIFFIVSDLILTVTYFSKEDDYKKEGLLNPESKLFIVTNHVTYYIAQFLIAYAILWF